MNAAWLRIRGIAKNMCKCDLRDSSHTVCGATNWKFVHDVMIFAWSTLDLHLQPYNIPYGVSEEQHTSVLPWSKHHIWTIGEQACKHEILSVRLAHSFFHPECLALPAFLGCACSISPPWGWKVKCSASGSKKWLLGSPAETPVSLQELARSRELL